MKKPICSVIAAALLVLALTGCATITSLIQGVPRWTISTPSATLTTISFVAEGSAQEDQTELARDRALNDLMNQLSAYIGYRLEDRYRRELVDNGEIADLSLFVADEFERSEDGKTTVYLLAEANRRTINNFRRIQQDRLAREGQEHLSYRDAARRNYARNQDTEAVHAYLEAARAAYASELPEHLELSQEYLNQAIGILERVRMEPQRRSDGDTVFSVRLVRDGRAFSSGIANAELIFAYPVYDSLGRRIQLEQQAATDVRGFASVQITHPGFRGSGRVTVHLDTSRFDGPSEVLRGSQELNTLVSGLYRLGGERQTYFSFTVLPEVLRGAVAASILEYDRAGDLRHDAAATEALVEVFRENTVNAVPMTVSPGPQVQVIQSILQQAGQGVHAVVGEVEIVSVVHSRDRFVATARGEVQIVETRTRRVLASTDTVVANGTGASDHEAKTAALRRFGEIAASVLLNTL